MLGWLPLTALAASVQLHVYVHPDAGSAWDVAGDGADGQCAVRLQVIECPASAPVRFRWGADPAWALVGDTVVAPGEQGVAWVLAAAGPRLSAADATPEAVIRVFGQEAPVPSRATFDDLLALAAHDDPMVRRAVVEVAIPWLSRATTGPLPAGAPSPLAGDLLARLAKDPDPRVRRRVALALREVRPAAVEGGGEALAALATDKDRATRRIALASLDEAVHAELLPAEKTWALALAAVPEPDAIGASAAGTLGRLARDVAPSDVVDPGVAVQAVLAHHPERAWLVWFQWREHVPFERAWAEQLLRGTSGLHRGLLLHWAETEPAGLAEAIRRWEPRAPHTERFRIAGEVLAGVEHPELRAALGAPP